MRSLGSFNRLLALALLSGCLAVIGPVVPAQWASANEGATPARTIVSITFDDGFASVQAARWPLTKHHMNGTFYIPSGLVDRPGRLTWTEIQALQQDGNEIGGHTVNHLHLDTLDQPEQARQICDDRAALTAHGLTVTSFAYPFDGHTPATEAVVRACGYNSARSEGGLTGTCEGVCGYAESTPPEDPYSLRSASPVVTSTNVESIKQQITDAESHGGGWLPLVFHDVCTACSDMAISPDDFEALLTWLDSEASNGISVSTVTRVIGGQVRPAAVAPADSRPPGELINSSLETPANTGPGSLSANSSQCWERSKFGVNSAVWARVPSAHSGSWAEQVSIRNYISGDQKLLITQDSGSCSPAVIPGQTYEISAWYTGSAPTRIVAFYRLSTGAWKYWMASPPGPPSATWQPLHWETPPMPPDATRISFGLQLESVGTLTIDDYQLRPSDGNSPASIGSGLGLLLESILLVLVILPTLTYLGWRWIRGHVGYLPVRTLWLPNSRP